MKLVRTCTPATLGLEGVTDGQGVLMPLGHLPAGSRDTPIGIQREWIGRSPEGCGCGWTWGSSWDLDSIH